MLSKQNQYSTDRHVQLIPSELALYEYTTALGDWLEPHHDYVRPPPAAVMSEVSRLAEQKAGQQPKGLPPPLNGDLNEHAKKDEEQPVIKEPSEGIVKFYTGELLGLLSGKEVTEIVFVDMKARFQTALKDSAPLSELLNVVALTQEVRIEVAHPVCPSHTPSICKAFLIFLVTTTRFRPSSVIKAHKLSQASITIPVLYPPPD